MCARFYLLHLIIPKEETIIYYPYKKLPLPKKNKELLNENIRFSTVMLIDEEGKRIGNMSSRQALAIAEEHGLDLYCIAPQAKPPVCRIMNYSKYRYEKQKAEKEAKSHQQRPDEVKEIKITALTGEHDLETKANQASKLLDKGWRLKITVYLKGRMITRVDSAEVALNKLLDLLKDKCVVDKAPTKEGRKYFCYVKPIKK